MKVRLSFYKVLLLLFGILFILPAKGQFLVDLIDTNSTAEKGLWAIYRNTDHLQISGYFQPQFQVAQSKGAENFSGGDFSKYSNNRFMMRRGRIRFDYAHFNDQGLPQAQVEFQFDGTERGVSIRDFWGRLYENKWQLFSFTTGMFARPFGYELNYSSADRESPERGRMSQELMKTERDLGVMVTFEPRKKTNPLRLFKLDAGVFNGQGLIATEEYDSYKDFIGRLTFKPYKLSDRVTLSAGASLFEGGVVQNSKYIYRMTVHGDGKNFQLDSSETNVGRKGPRSYRGIDGQVKIKNGLGRTELKAEYWWGTQTASAKQSLTPAAPLTEPHYIRNFDGVYLYLIHNILNSKHSVALKYDYYDPNRRIKGSEIGSVNSNSRQGDIRYNTFGFGYIFLLDEHVKLLLWYDRIKNETTQLPGFTSDIKDNIFTCRLQFRF